MRAEKVKSVYYPCGEFLLDEHVKNLQVDMSERERETVV